jgi:hypothetical protein
MLCILYSARALSGSIPLVLLIKQKYHPILLDGTFVFGGDEGDRTPYLLTASQALSQVSYTPTYELIIKNNNNPILTINAISVKWYYCVY